MDYFRDLDMAVITTKFVFKQNSVITSVFHYDDGWWQFNGDENDIDEDDFMIVSLKEVLLQDESVSTLKSMVENKEATRVDRNSDWVIKDCQA